MGDRRSAGERAGLVALDRGGRRREGTFAWSVFLSVLVTTAALGGGCYRSHRRLEPSRPTTGYVTIGAGDDHTCAVRVDGSIDCWGLAQHGELGDGSGREELGCEVRVTEGPSRNVATRALLETPAFLVTGGGRFTCAALEGGGASCWGASCQGELGDGSTRPRFVPGSIPSLTRVTTLGLGLEHACAIAGGAISCWGANDFGQLGLGTTSPHTEPGSTTPLVVRDAPAGAFVLALGDGHSCAASPSGVSCWGANGAGQLGDGTIEPRSRARPVLGLPLAPIVGLGAGERFTCASLEGAGVWCWGWNERYQLGSSHRCDAPIDECMRSETPLEVPLPEIDGSWSIACGAAFVCAWGASPPNDGVWCWGADEVGQLGDGEIGGVRATPARVLDAPRAPVEVTLGDNHGCALDARGEVSCWGRNAQGQLGDGTTLDRPRARPIASAD